MAFSVRAENIGEPNRASKRARICATRAAVIRATTNPETAAPTGYVDKRMNLTAEQWSNLFGDRMHAASRVD